MSAYDNAVKALTEFIYVELEASNGDFKETKALVKKIVKDAWQDESLDDFEYYGE